MRIPARPPTSANRDNDCSDYYRRRLRDCVLNDAAAIAPLGAGDTWARFRYLRDIARADLSLARLLEGHLDATSILREADHTVDTRLTYAIWASGGPTATTRLLQRSGGVVLTGNKPFCSGADLVDRALLHTDENATLVDVDIASAGAAITYHREGWAAPAFASIHTWTSEFKDLTLPTDALVGESNWYFRRCGFWQGALCPAACWAGGAIGLVDYAREHGSDNAHARAHLGALLAAERSMNSNLKCAAQEVDEDPQNRRRQAYPRALAVRHTIERLCHTVLDHFGRMLGPRPLAYDQRIAQQYAELTLYLRQCHAERDLEELGAHALEASQ